jgi:hypothetical protein
MFDARTHTETMRLLHELDKAQGLSDYNKELYVHDFCLSQFKYDFALNTNAHSILGLVLNRSAVCEGIAKFVKLALDYLGVKSLIVYGNAHDPSSNTSSSHAWNIVKLDEKTLHLDVTFDLTITSHYHRYDYFNLSDKEISQDHEWVRNVPICNTEGLDYYSANGLSLNNLTSLNKLITHHLQQGKTHFAVKIRDMPNNVNLTKKGNRKIQEYIVKQTNLCQNGGEVRRCTSKDIGQDAYAYIVEKSLRILHTELTENIVRAHAVARHHTMETLWEAQKGSGDMIKAYLP